LATGSDTRQARTGHAKGRRQGKTKDGVGRVGPKPGIEACVEETKKLRLAIAKAMQRGNRGKRATEKAKDRYEGKERRVDLEMARKIVGTRLRKKNSGFKA